MEPFVKDKEHNKLAVAGKIKIGTKKKITNRQNRIVEIPESLDYFIASGDYADHFNEVFGDKPQKIEILFTSDNLFDVCYYRYENRSGKKLFAIGDGEEFSIYNDKSDCYEFYNISEYPNIKDMVKQRTGSNWTANLTLRFFIPRIKTVLCAWQFDTKADETSIPQIIGTIKPILEKRKSIVGIPFDLIVKKVTSQRMNSKSSFPVVNLVANLSNKELTDKLLMIE